MKNIELVCRYLENLDQTFDKEFAPCQPGCPWGGEHQWELIQQFDSVLYYAEMLEARRNNPTDWIDEYTRRSGR